MSFLEMFNMLLEDGMDIDDARKVAASEMLSAQPDFDDYEEAAYGIV